MYNFEKFGVICNKNFVQSSFTEFMCFFFTFNVFYYHESYIYETT